MREYNADDDEDANTLLERHDNSSSDQEEGLDAEETEFLLQSDGDVGLIERIDLVARENE